MMIEKPPPAAVVLAPLWCLWSTRFQTKVRGLWEWSMATALGACRGSVCAGCSGSSCHRRKAHTRRRPCRVSARSTWGGWVAVRVCFSIYRNGYPWKLIFVLLVPLKISASLTVGTVESSTLESGGERVDRVSKSALAQLS